jgi:hypothetical protein
VSEGGHERLPHKGLRHGIGGTSNDSSGHICRSLMPSRTGGGVCSALLLATHGCRRRGYDLTYPHKHPTTQQCTGQFLTGDAVGPKDETLPPRTTTVRLGSLAWLMGTSSPVSWSPTCDIRWGEGTIGGQRVAYTRMSTLDQNTAR